MMIFGIIIIILGVLLLLPFVIVLAKGLYEIYEAAAHGDMDEMYGLIVMFGMILLIAGLLVCFYQTKYPGGQQLPVNQEEPQNER